MKILFVRSGNRGPDPVSQNQADSLTRQGINVVCYDIIGKRISGYFKNIVYLKKRIRSEDPDILHAHYVMSGFLSVLTLSRKPIIVSLMGSDVNNAGRLQLFLIRLFIKCFWSGTIVKTKRMCDKLGINDVKILPNGIDLNVFNPVGKEVAQNTLSWDSGKKNILFGSDPERIEKNYDLFSRSINLLKSYYPDIEIHQLNGIPRKNVYLHYCAADVTVLTSSSEGSPNVIKEAMACNCPIVSTDVGDVSEIIGDTEGCFITGFDPDDVSGKIKLVLDSGKRTCGREKIARLSSDIIAEQLIGIYRGIA